MPLVLNENFVAPRRIKKTTTRKSMGTWWSRRDPADAPAAQFKGDGGVIQVASLRPHYARRLAGKNVGGLSHVFMCYPARGVHYKAEGEGGGGGYFEMQVGSKNFSFWLERGWKEPRKGMHHRL